MHEDERGREAEFNYENFDDAGPISAKPSHSYGVPVTAATAQLIASRFIEVAAPDLREDTAALRRGLTGQPHRPPGAGQQVLD